LLRVLTDVHPYKSTIYFIHSSSSLFDL
jgi:hypothetical protein